MSRSNEFCRTYRSRSARIAFFAALRNIYLDAPHGGSGLWTRLTTLLPPALFVWGDSDRLVPAGFSRHVARAVPSARQVILPECGHVPQVELARPHQRADQAPHRRQRRGPLPPRGLAGRRHRRGSLEAAVHNLVLGGRWLRLIARHHDVAPAPCLFG